MVEERLQRLHYNLFGRPSLCQFPTFHSLHFKFPTLLLGLLFYQKFNVDFYLETKRVFKDLSNRETRPNCYLIHSLCFIVVFDSVNVVCGLQYAVAKQKSILFLCNEKSGLSEKL